jgi:hypothetical protein
MIDSSAPDQSLWQVALVLDKFAHSLQSFSGDSYSWTLSGVTPETSTGLLIPMHFAMLDQYDLYEQLEHIIWR